MNRIWSRTNFIFAISLISIGTISAQPSLSTYSAFGVGDPRSLAFVPNIGSGGLGLSYGTPMYLNNMNPALLPLNSITVFEAGIIGETKTVSRGDASDHNGAVDLNYLAMAFGLKPTKWTASIGLMPYTSVNYSFIRQGTIPGTDAILEITEEGSGGINQGYMAHGYRINNNLSVGVKISVLFSSIITETTTRIQDSNSASIFSPAIFDRLSFSDVMLSGGLAYKIPLKNDLKLNFGFTYDHEAKVNSKRFQRLELRDPNDLVIESDTLIDNQSGTVTIPSKFGLGISLNKGFKWLIGVDLKLQDWKRFRNFDNQNNGLDENFGVVVGGEYTPDVNSVSSYLKRVTYRIGFNFEKTPYVVNGEEIKEYGINFGWSLPISRISSANMAFQYGARGTTDNNLVKEQYFKIFFGITFNDRWFIRRKFD